MLTSSGWKKRHECTTLQYGTVDAKLYDRVTLKRAPGTQTMAPVWRSPVHLLQGPPETISVRARETAWDQIDEFIAEFLKQNPQD